MKKLVEKGIVAYFDILGYQNFIKSNKIKDCIEIIENILLTLPDEIKRDYLRINENSYSKWDEYLQGIRSNFTNHMNITFISDTIIFFFDFEKMEKNNIPSFLNQILFYLSVFMKLSFERGFPMRGYIDYGTFYFNNDNNKNIIAGEIIMKCHQETNNLDFSGLAISESIYKYCMEFDYFYLNTLFDKKYISKYLVNLKNKEDYKYVFNIIFGEFKNDLKQYIFDSFHKYNKEINNEVMRKINNTERIMRCFLSCNNNL